MGLSDRLREYGKQFNDGRYELFKSTGKYDGDLGRQQHNYQARRISGVKAAEIREWMKDIERDSLPTVAEGRKMADAWAGGDSEAARAVRLKDMDDRLKPFRQPSGETLPEPEWSEKQRAFLEHEARRGGWSGLEKAAHEYGQTVKNVARAGQDAYWQSMIGGKPKTEADRLHDLMWGEGKKEPEMER